MATSDVKITPGSGANIATYDISEDAETKKIQRISINDVNGTTITQTGSALDINIKSGQNANGLANASNSAPVVPATTTVTVAVTPTVTASAYSAGNVIGGVMTFAGLLDSVRFAGILESISIKFKAAAVTGEIDVGVFITGSLSGTYTDKTAPTFNSADAAKLVGIYALTIPFSTLGTMTCYNLDGIGKAILGTSTSLFVVATVKGTPTPASTTDMIVELGVLPG